MVPAPGCFDCPRHAYDNVVLMYGPLLISLLPPDRLQDTVKAVSDARPAVAIILLAGLLLSLFLHRPER